MNNYLSLKCILIIGLINLLIKIYFKYMILKIYLLNKTIYMVYYFIEKRKRKKDGKWGPNSKPKPIVSKCMA